jgi:hypothetical protein
LVTTRWDRASKYVVHFGHPRVPGSLEELQTFEVSADAMKSMARDAFEVLEVLVAQLEAAETEGPVLTVERHRGRLHPRDFRRAAQAV